jgi:hypothetical protein
VISEDRQSRIAHILIDVWYDDDLVDLVNDDESNALRIAKKAIANWVKSEADVDGEVRKQLDSLKKKLIEGTPEWEIMYKKYYDQEMNRRG